MNISSILAVLEHDLDKIAEDNHPDPKANRRLKLRQALRRAEQLGYEAGYSEGLMDGGMR